MSSLKKLVNAAAALTLFFTGVGQAAADQAYPERPIRWIVPYSPGGGTDFTARYLSTQMKDFLQGQSFVVENRAGGATVIGMQTTARAPADGYTIAIATDTLIANPYLLKSVPYEVSDFEPVGTLLVSPLVLLAKPDAPVNTLEEAFAWIKDSKQPLTYGSWGIGSTAHLAGEDLSDRLGAEMIHVPYQGAAASVVAMLGGELDLLLTSANVALPHIIDGKLKALGVTTKEPIAQLPGVPALASVLPDYEMVAWIGVVGPKGMPKSAVDKLSAAFAEQLSNPEVIKTFLDRGEVISFRTPDEFSTLLEQDSVRLKDIIEKRKILLDN